MMFLHLYVTVLHCLKRAITKWKSSKRLNKQFFVLFRICMYPMLKVSQMSTTSTTNLMRHALFNQTGTPRRVKNLRFYSRHRHKGAKCLSQGYKDALPNSRTESRQPTWARIHWVAPPLVVMTVLSVFQGYNRTFCAQYYHRSSNLAISIWHSNRLSDAASFDICLFDLWIQIFLFGIARHK